jgi:2-hydroxychromene-2-carboxylate isomerase
VTHAIELYFDFISPYAYLAWTQIHRLADKHGVVVAPRPILFAALLDANKTKGPAEIPAKRVWVFKDTFRRAAYAGVPFAPPPAHPFNPLLALRVASVDQTEEQRRLAIDTLFRAVWGGGPGVTEEATVRELLTTAGLDGDALVEAAHSAEIKARVRARTEEALSRGVFGVPTMIVDDELFWGLDSFDHLERFLEGRDVLRSDELSRWRDLPASSQRKAAKSP